MDKQYKKGYNATKESIKEGQNPLILLNQARTSLTRDSFDRGWMDACKEEIEKEIKKTEETGRKITEYLNQYKGNPIYNDITLAIQFGVQLNSKE